jgi:outer membrane protein
MVKSKTRLAGRARASLARQRSLLSFYRLALFFISQCALAIGMASGTSAETLTEMLARVYQNNPQLNAARAQLRATDETVPQALSGYRPTLSVGALAGYNPTRNTFPDGSQQYANLRPWMAGVTLTQPLFNGFRTGNTVRQAEAQVRSGREGLRNIEQTVFVSAVTTYMNVLADQTLVEAQRANVTFLRETLESTRKSLDAGNVTPTDVAQSEARLARGQSDLNAAEVALASDQAIYAQVTGAPPGRLVSAEPADRVLPRVREEALAISRHEHPTIVGASFDIDAAEAAVKVAEGALMATVNVQATASHSSETDTTFGTQRTDQAAVMGNATVPIYDGGLAAAQVRASKETLSQIRIVLDQVRLANDTAVITAWVQNEGAKTAIKAGEAEVRAATIALAGVQREHAAGQRTTLEVLNSEQDLLAAKGRLISAQRDRVVASYTLLSAIGRFDRKRLELPAPDYDPQTHYIQVRDAWFGLRTPSGQ